MKRVGYTVAPLSFYLSSQRLAETMKKDIYGIFYADIVTAIRIKAILISPTRQPIPLRSIRFIPFRK